MRRLSSVSNDAFVAILYNHACRDERPRTSRVVSKPGLAFPVAYLPHLQKNQGYDNSAPVIACDRDKLVVRMLPDHPHGLH